MYRIINAFEQWLTAEERSFRAEGEQELTGQVSDTWGRWEWHLWATSNDDLLDMMVSIPVFAPEESRARVAEYLTRVNWSAIFGAFSMDYIDGEMRYRIRVPVSLGELGPEWAGEIMRCTMFTISVYVPELLKVAFAEASPAEAFERADAWRSAPAQEAAVEPADDNHHPPEAARSPRRRHRRAGLDG